MVAHVFIKMQFILLHYEKISMLNPFLHQMRTEKTRNSLSSHTEKSAVLWLPFTPNIKNSYITHPSVSNDATIPGKLFL